jgi:hypothetical protein
VAGPAGRVPLFADYQSATRREIPLVALDADELPGHVVHDSFVVERERRLVADGDRVGDLG